MNNSFNSSAANSSTNSTSRLLFGVASLAGLGGICIGYGWSRYILSKASKSSKSSKSSVQSNVVLSKGYRGKLQTIVRDYIDKQGNRNVEYYQDICDATRKEHGEIMEGWTVSIDQSYFLQWLMPALGIKKSIEVGVFTGCSSLAMALGMGENGQLIAFDIKESKKYTDIAEKYWTKAGVRDRINLSHDGGIIGLDKLLEDKNNIESFDFAFVDAHKSEYLEYYKRLIKLIKIGGYIAYDNTIYEGKVADKSNFTDELTEGIREFNSFVHNDKRVEIAMVYLGDGTTFCRKISN